LYTEVASRRYRVLHPRPVYVIIVEAEGKVNAMAASWVSPVSEEPERIALALDKESYTRELLAKTEYFTVNVVNERHVELVWCVGTRSGRETDKISECGVRLAPAEKIPSKRLGDALGWIEARVHRVIDDIAEDVDLIIADVVAAYARSDAYNPRYGWELAKAKILLHASGRAFTTPGRLIIAKRG